MSYPWNSGDQLNAADLDQIALSNVVQLTAAEAITSGAPLAAGYYQTDGGIKLDTSKSSGQASGSSVSDSITVASNTNRIVIVVIASQAAITGVTIGGSAATQIDNTTGGTTTMFMGAWYVLNPTAGSVAVAATIGSSTTTNWAIYSYYNVAQTSTIAAHSIAAGTSSVDVNSNITPGETGDLVFGYIGAIGNSGGLSYTLTGLPNNRQVPTNRLPNGYFGTGDNGQAVNTAQQGILFTHSGGAGNPGTIAGTFALKPFTAATLGAAVLASSATGYTTAASTNFRSIAFIGFAASTVSAGQTLIVLTSGVVGGLSGLVPFSVYYLNDTLGTIGTSVGSITRKVGIAVDTTHLLISNIW